MIALGRPEASASEYIAEIQRRLAQQDAVRYRMHAIGTSLEGSTEDILRAAYPRAESLRYRDVTAAYFAGSGLNAVVPARGGDDR